MRALYIEPFSGISGNMLLGALLDAGVPFDWLRAQLEQLNIGEYALVHESVNKMGIQARYFNVLLPEEHDHAHGHDHVHGEAHEHDGAHSHDHGTVYEHIHEHGHDHVHVHEHGHDHGHGEESHHHTHVHRNYADICAILDGANLSESLRAQAKRVFFNLAQAEAKVHGKALEEIHFHEVGAIDCLVDIIGNLMALDYLKVDRIFTGMIVTGRGFVQCAHGIMPVPAPATAELLNGLPHMQGEVATELTTPTGAALLKTLATPLADLPADFEAELIGYGAGTKDLPQRPNVLRVVLGQMPEPGASAKAVAKAAPTALVQPQRGPLARGRKLFTKPEAPAVDATDVPGTQHAVAETANPDTGDRLLLEANIDDMNPELFPYVLQRLLDAGALDAWLEPIIMKKGRPAYKLCALTTAEEREALEIVMFTETTTLGVRCYPVERTGLERRELDVETPWGKVRAKAAYLHGFLVNVAPEFEDCAKLAAAQELPLKLLMDGAKSAALKQADPELA